MIIISSTSLTLSFLLLDHLLRTVSLEKTSTKWILRRRYMSKRTMKLSQRCLGTKPYLIVKLANNILHQKVDKIIWWHIVQTQPITRAIFLWQSD